MPAYPSSADEIPLKRAEWAQSREKIAAPAQAKHLWVWAALAAILALYVFSALRLKPAATFGIFGDDAIYFSSAKAIASGQGYILPGFPGHLPSMKYPELYPLLLAGVWKIDPHFPGNLRLAIGITLAFGCTALLITFLMLRRWPGLGDGPALGVALLVGLSGGFVYLSPRVLTDIPFMALMLGAAWLAEISLDDQRALGRGEFETRPYRGDWAAAGAGVLAGMSVGLRALGIPVAAGIGLLLLFRRKFRKLFWFCLTGLPLTLYWSWPAVSAVLGLSPPAVVGDPTRSGWTQTVCYYSSYACEWRMNVSSLGALKSVVSLNLRFIAQGPGTLLLRPLGVNGTIGSLVLVILLSAAAYVGIVRSWRRDGCRPLHAILPLYLPAIAVFPYDPGRYLLAFAPLFFAGIWLEGKYLATLVIGCLRQGRSLGERVTAGMLAAGGLAIAGLVAVNYARAAPSELKDRATRYARLHADEIGAYAWIRERSGRNSRVIAHDDGVAYLYTGRAAVRPGPPLSQVFYLGGQPRLERGAKQLGDVARQVDASYWLTGPDEFLIEKGPDRARLLQAEARLLARAPAVYRSADGLVTLYDTRELFGGRGSKGGR